MNSFLFGFTLVFGVYGQYAGWDCNHYEEYTVDRCYHAGSLAYLYTCVGTDAIRYTTYTDGTCGESNTSYVTKYTYTNGSGITWECGKSEACDVAIVSFYGTEDCTGEYTESSYIIGQCYSASSSISTSSTIYTCSSSTSFIGFVNIHQVGKCKANLHYILSTLHIFVTKTNNSFTFAKIM